MADGEAVVLFVLEKNSCSSCSNNPFATRITTVPPSTPKFGCNTEVRKARSKFGCPETQSRILQVPEKLMLSHSSLCGNIPPMEKQKLYH